MNKKIVAGLLFLTFVLVPISGTALSDDVIGIIFPDSINWSDNTYIFKAPISSDNITICVNCVNGSTSNDTSKWVDGGTYIYPNSSYADDVNIDGDLNVTGNMNLIYSPTIYSDMYMAAAGPLVIDNTKSSGTYPYVDIRSGDDGWGIIFRSYNNLYMYGNIFMHAGYQDYIQIVAAADASTTPGLTIGTGANQHVGVNSVPSAIYMLNVGGSTATSQVTLTNTGDSVLVNGDICYEPYCNTNFIDFGNGVVDIYSGQSNNANIKIRSSAIIINENGNADDDFRVEGDTDQYLLWVDASSDAVGIGNATPTEKLSVDGNVIANDYLYTTNTPDFSNVNVEDWLYDWTDYIKPDGSYDHKKDWGYGVKTVPYNYTEEVYSKNGTLIDILTHEGNLTIEYTSITNQTQWLREVARKQKEEIDSLEARIAALETGVKP